jgi:hypothetical protein
MLPAKSTLRIELWRCAMTSSCQIVFVAQRYTHGPGGGRAIEQKGDQPLVAAECLLRRGLPSDGMLAPL